MSKLRPLSIRDLFDLNAVGRVAISPDGTLIAFEQKKPDLDENKNLVHLWLVNVETGALRALTDGKHCNMLPRWSPDGTKLAFISNREKVNCIYVMPMDGGEPRRVTDRDGQVTDFAWSPDGRKFVFTYQPLSERQKLERDEKKDELKKRPAYKHITRLFHKLDGSGWWNGQYTHVFTISSAGGKARQLTRGDFDHREPRFSPNGRLVSFVANRLADPDFNSEQADIYTLPAAGGAAPRRITQMPGPVNGHSWSPDGSQIAFIGSPAPTGKWHLYNEHVWVVDARGGKPREISREIDNACRNVTLADVASAAFEVAPPLWSADGERLFFVVSEQGATRLFTRSLGRKDLRCLTEGQINVMFVHRAAGDGPLAMSIGTNTNPGDVYVLDLASDEPRRRLTHVNSELLSRVRIQSPEEFRVKSDGVEVQGWVLRPPEFDPRRKYPAILQIHGGPTAQFGYGFFHELQLMASRGYVVAFANPRGGCGYGLKFMNCIHADWGNLDYRDVMKAADWLFRQPYVDTRRVGVTGGSYGGYMTNWVVGHTDRFRAAVTQRCVSNMESMFGTSDYGRDLGLEFGGMPWDRREEFRRMSPLSYVTKIRTPLLIEHEEEDHRCPIEQGEQLFTSLKALGRTVEMVRFEGESHGLCRSGRPQNRAERLRRILDWFDRYMPAEEETKSKRGRKPRRGAVSPKGRTG